MEPRHESFTKRGKIFVKEPKYVERDCVTALKEITLLHFQQWIDIYIKWFIFSRSLAMKSNAGEKKF